MSQEEAGKEIRQILDRYGIVGLLSEVGEGGEIRVTFSGKFDPDAAGEIVDLIREHTLARRKP